MTISASHSPNTQETKIDRYAPRMVGVFHPGIDFIRFTSPPSTPIPNGNDCKNVGSGTIPDQRFGDKRTATYTHGGLLRLSLSLSPLVRVVEDTVCRSFVRDLPKVFTILYYRITNVNDTFHFSML